MLFGLFKGSSSASKEAREWVGQGALLLDVRTPAEFAAGHIEGAVNIPLQDLGARIGEVDGHSRVVVYCRSGGRSAGAAAFLKRNGVPDVFDLGAMSRW